MKKMTLFGIGPLWGSIVLAYGAASTFVDFRYSVLRIPTSFGQATLVAGILLLAVGVPYYAVSARTIIRGFPTGKLLTTGVYRVCRHPLYGSWIAFIIPGIGLLLRSGLGLTTAVAAYALLRFMAGAEESYLAGRFGEDYAAYRRRTPFVLPTGFLAKDRG